MPLQKVAELFNTSYEVIRRLAKSREVEFRRKRMLTAEQRQEAIDLLNSGVPLRQVARQFGINRYSLRRLLEGDEG